jgi:hypothetical protein
MRGLRAVRVAADPYGAFGALDGGHPLRAAVPNGFVDYPARRVPGSSVVFFNFELARRMGLIPEDHADAMTPELARSIVDAFAIRIVNEYDAARERGPRARTTGPYMATRYLQLQHPGRRGDTSGDGRSVWLGTVQSRGVRWDVSACGTGSTRLCPATAWTGRYFKTGSRRAAYGCGTASVFEGLSAALMSESFHRNGIATERVLAVVETPGGCGVTVRAYPSLLRPAHFLIWLKQGNLDALRGVAELFVERQIANGTFPELRGADRWSFLAQWVARSFARASATFESEYVFCWLDWDGDNILMDGGVLDYGSVRQFGLYHREYRYDDGPRWSTTIAQQRAKARHIAACFAQIRDWLMTGRRRRSSTYRNDPVVRLFDREFETCRLQRLLRGLGFEPHVADALATGRRALAERFQREHRYFEEASARRPRSLPDGITRDAVYSTRDLLRELPVRYLADEAALSPAEFLRIAASTYALKAHRRATPRLARRALAFQRAYLALVRAAAAMSGSTSRAVLREMRARSAIVNRFARITGDASIDAARRLVRERKRLGPDATYALIRRIIEEHATLPRAPRRQFELKRRSWRAAGALAVRVGG